MRDGIQKVSQKSEAISFSLDISTYSRRTTFEGVSPFNQYRHQAERFPEGDESCEYDQEACRDASVSILYQPVLVFCHD
jgi:hypothetical protein